KFRFIAESHANPLGGNLFSREGMIPRQTTKSIPVGLRKMVPAPVGVQSNVGNTSNSTVGVRIDCTIGTFSHGGVLSLTMGVTFQEFLPLWGKENQVIGETEILLCDLQFRHDGCLLYGSKQGTEWLPWLKIYRSILDLNDYIIAKCSI